MAFPSSLVCVFDGSSAAKYCEWTLLKMHVLIVEMHT